MNQFWHDNLRALVEYPLVRCVSLFLPVVHTWPKVQQNAIRVEALLRAAEQQLAARHIDAASVEELVVVGMGAHITPLLPHGNG